MRHKKVVEPEVTEIDHGHTKYDRSVHPKQVTLNPDGSIKEIIIDVYAVLDAFNVTCPARQHEVKKLLCAGLRGKATEMQDLYESEVAHKRAINLQISREARKKNA